MSRVRGKNILWYGIPLHSSELHQCPGPLEMLKISWNSIDAPGRFVFFNQHFGNVMFVHWCILLRSISIKIYPELKLC